MQSSCIHVHMNKLSHIAKFRIWVLQAFRVFQYSNTVEDHFFAITVCLVCLCLDSQSEVATLAEASAKKQAAIFTPYLLPDAPSLCTGLHIIKKLLKTEKFVIIITKSGMYMYCC